MGGARALPPAHARMATCLQGCPQGQADGGPVPPCSQGCVHSSQCLVHGRGRRGRGATDQQQDRQLEVRGILQPQEHASPLLLPILQPVPTCVDMEGLAGAGAGAVGLASVRVMVAGAVGVADPGSAVAQLLPHHRCMQPLPPDAARTNRLLVRRASDHSGCHCQRACCTALPAAGDRVWVAHACRTGGQKRVSQLHCVPWHINGPIAETTGWC